MFLFGSSGYSLLFNPGFELYWENTMFQISKKRSFSKSSPSNSFGLLGSILSPLSKCTSVHGPHGPSPISQNASSAGISFSSGTPKDSQTFLASRSVG